MTTVSIHIVTYNSKAHIKRCLLCVKKQTYKHCSVLVVDNASSDTTVNICASLRVRVIKNTKNIGYAAAHNQALQATKSTYVLTLNPDVFLEPTFVQHLVFHLNSDKQIGSACGVLSRIDTVFDTPKRIDGAGLFMRKNRRQGLRFENDATTNSLNTEYIFGPDGAAAFYRRSMLKDIAIKKEVFDEDFFMHKEDVDVAWRAQRAGWKSLVVSEAKALHIRTFRAGKRNVVSPALQRMSLRNRYLLLIKNDNLAYYFRDLFPIVLYDIAIFCYVLCFEKTSFGAYREVFSLWSKMMEKRKYIQKNWPNSQQAYTYFY